MKRLAIVLLGLMLGGFLAGCQTETKVGIPTTVQGGGTPPPGVTLQSITVTPANPSVPKGLTQQFTATGHFSDGSTQNLTATVTWGSANTAIATISASGLATAVSQGGPINITATMGAVSGSTGLTVTAPVLQSITLTPLNFSLAQGATVQFTATGHFSDGSTQDLTATVTWGSANTAVATISASGLAAGVSPGGPINITATSGAINGSTGLTVTLPGPRFAFFGSLGDNTLAVYAVDATTGQLRARGNVLNPSGGIGVHQLGLNPAGTLLYGTDQTAGNGVIEGYTVSTGGVLAQITGVNPFAFSTGTDPNCVLTDPTGNFLYVASPGSGINVFSISGSGTISQISGSPFGVAAANGNCIAMNPAGTFAFVSNDGPTNANTAQPFTVNSSTGALTAGSTVASGTTPQELVVTPDGNFLYVVNEASNNVSGYSINGTTGALTAVSGSPFSTDSVPQGITTDIAGKFVYVASAAKGIDAFSIGSGGTLTAVSGSPFGSSHSPSDPAYLKVKADSSGKFLLAESTSGFVDTLSINASTGALTILSSMVARNNPQSIAISHGAPLAFTPTFAFVANATANSVSAFSVDPTTGALTAVSGSPFSTGTGTSPQSVATDLTGKFLYTANSGTGTVSGFTIGSNGALTAISGSPFSTGGTAPTSVFVDPSFRYLFAANSGSKNYAGFSIDSSSGALTLLGASPFTVGTTPVALTMDPSGNWLFIANSGDKTVTQNTITASTGGGGAAPGSPTTVGTNPQAVAVDATGNFLYVANTGDGKVSAFQIASNGSGLTAVTGSPFSVGTMPVAITSDTTGKFLYVANAGSDNVSAFTISSTGALSAITGSPFTAGTTPQSLYVDISGKFLYVANSGSGNVSVFSIGSNGALTEITGSPFTAGSGAHAVVLTGTVQ